MGRPLNERERALLELAPKSVGRLLSELAELSRREVDGERLAVPQVTLHLRSGRDVRGRVLRVEAAGAGELEVVFHQPGNDPRNLDYDALYLPAAVVEAVTVHDVPSLARTPADASPAPSRLEVRRKAEALRTSLSTALGLPILCGFADDIPEGEGLRAVADAIDGAGEILALVAKEPLGSAALKEKVRSLQFETGPTAGVQLDKQQLSIRTTVAPLGRMSRAQLRAAIEAAL